MIASEYEQRQRALNQFINRTFEQLTARMDLRIKAGTLLTDQSPLFTEAESLALVKECGQALDPSVELPE